MTHTSATSEKLKALKASRRFLNSVFDNALYDGFDIFEMLSAIDWAVKELEQGK